MSQLRKSEHEVEIESSAHEFFHVFRSKAHNIPNVCPQKVSAIDVHAGDWETQGSIKQWSYVVDGKSETSRETVEAIDDENKSITFNVLDGDMLQNYKSLKAFLQVTGKEDKGALVKWTIEYEKTNENAPDPDKYMDLVVSMTKDIDQHLLKA
ncbi:unnamed protein product [Thlaspi arvense]|uniref:Bet v I/Major latex protein domain-containing protein n=1 Tax=Thlaspi arvense TaxID=13288 RepID=A0AAU9TCU5_THLAR|nr:unnamed protein product [Thlaspi arvense]